MDEQCIEIRRINVSAAFFLSIEFQETGYLAYRFHRASYGRMPRFAEFMPDTQAISQGIIVNAEGWKDKLEANKRAFAEAWVARPAFIAEYPMTMSERAFVDKLFATAGITPEQSERDALVNGLIDGSATRATVVRKVAESSALDAQEKNNAFVLMQYFGYLRRNPDDAPNIDMAGYNFWLAKLNEFNGNFVDAEMVKAFITSGEYRSRFGTN